MAKLELYTDKVYTGQNTNSLATVTAWIDISTCSFISFFVEGKTGTHTTHKVGIECSPDSTFNGGFHGDSTTLITGEGHKMVDASNISYVRMAVETVEGATSTCDFYLQAFR